MEKQHPGPVEQALREFRWSFVVTALAFIALGLVLILWPHASMNVLCYLVGAILTAYGVFNILSFLFNRDRSISFELVIGVLTAAIGIFVLVCPGAIQGLLFVILGLAIIIDSLLGIKRSFSLKELNVKAWWIVLALSVAAACLGLLFITQTELFGQGLLIVIGCVLLYQGCSDLATVIQISICGRRIKKQLEQSDIIDIEPED